MPQIYEYRGVEGLVYAPVTSDTSEGITYGAVKPLAGVAEISKATDSTNEAHYYDNLPAVVVSSTGSDEITISASAIPLDVSSSSAVPFLSYPYAVTFLRLTVSSADAVMFAALIDQGAT